MEQFQHLVVALVDQYGYVGLFVALLLGNIGAPVGSEIVFWAELIDGEGEVAMPGRVQWATFARFSVLFGPLGARETRAVVRATRSSAS